MAKSKSVERPDEVDNDHREKDVKETKENKCTSKNIVNVGSILLITYVVSGISQGCFSQYNSLLPWLGRRYGMDPITFGLLQGSTNLIQFFVHPLLGHFGDIYGARAVLLVNVLSLIFGQITLGLASGAMVIILSRTLNIVHDIKIGAKMMISDMVSDSERGVALGKMVLPLSIGMAVGPPLSGQLAKLVGPQETLLITWILLMLCIIMMMMKIPKTTRHNNGGGEPSGKKPSILSVFMKKEVIVLLLMKVLYLLPYVILAQHIAIICQRTFEFTHEMNSYVLYFNMTISVISSVFALGKLSKKYDEDQLLWLASLLMFSTYLMVSLADSVWILLAGLIPFNLGSAILDTQILSRMIRAATTHRTGVIVGLITSLSEFVRICSASIGSYFIYKLSYHYIGYFGMIISVLLAGVLLITVTRKPHKKDE